MKHPYKEGDHNLEAEEGVDEDVEVQKCAVDLCGQQTRGLGFLAGDQHQVGRDCTYVTKGLMPRKPNVKRELNRAVDEKDS